MRVTERKLRSLIRRVLIESYNVVFDETTNFNTLELTLEQAESLLEGEPGGISISFDYIKRLSSERGKPVIVIDDQIRLDFDGRRQQTIVILEYISESWRLLWRPVENHMRSYQTEVQSYTGGKIEYSGCIMNRDNVKNVIGSASLPRY